MKYRTTLCEAVCLSPVKRGGLSRSFSHRSHCHLTASRALPSAAARADRCARLALSSDPVTPFAGKKKKKGTGGGREADPPPPPPVPSRYSASPTRQQF